MIAFSASIGETAGEQRILKLLDEKNPKRKGEFLDFTELKKAEGKRSLDMLLVHAREKTETLH